MAALAGSGTAPQGNRSRRKPAIAWLALAMPALLTGFSPAPAQDLSAVERAIMTPALRGADDRVTDAFESMEVSQSDSIRAVVRALETATLSSEVNASITYLPEREGDSFREGDLLVEFDCRRAQAEHAAATASTKGLESAYQSQRRMLEYKAAGTAAVEQARFQLEKAQAEQRLYAVRLEGCRIYAPFDGRMIEKMVQVHEVAQPNQPIMRIMNQSKIELVMMVPSKRLPEIAKQRFPVRIDETGSVYQARVLQTTGLIDPVSQSIRVLAEFVEPAPDLLPGMSGTAMLDETGTSDE